MESDTALTLERYRDQQARWPAAGRHILAQYDETSVVEYQAYRPAIENYAARHGRFGGEFTLTLPFTFQGGKFSSVSVTLTNGQGSSDAMTANF